MRLIFVFLIRNCIYIKRMAITFDLIIGNIKSFSNPI